MKTKDKKTKLTLTVRKDIILLAKKKAKQQGVSVSRLFEDVFKEKLKSKNKSKEQIAGEALIEFLDNQPYTEPNEQSDKELIVEHLKKKHG
ncbi:hypothetical protein SAMN05421640_0474 [Ekhidna lutea]|uniref:Ribbon-helix-helix protein, copG family n=1 Tax=Ekhidna lutea TaxID=447679 RepID=A0A239F3K2_EKHLU|nr:DUF6364 family protein [Ekhidna lutea]SNS51496.1 hypothetical protein SAMN05421640_0474 [Ekhidna lutea]